MTEFRVLRYKRAPADPRLTSSWLRHGVQYYRDLATQPRRYNSVLEMGNLTRPVGKPAGEQIWGDTASSGHRLSCEAHFHLAVVLPPELFKSLLGDLQCCQWLTLDLALARLTKYAELTP